MMSDSRRLLKVGIKLVLIWLALSALGYFYGQEVIDASLPMMKNFAQNITDDFYVNLFWEKDNPRMLMIDANFGVPKVSIQALGINPGASVSAGTNVEHILVPLILLLLVILCWPVEQLKHRLILLALSLPGALITLLLTTPYLLVGKVESLLQEQAAKMRVVREEPLYLNWMLFTEAGGRWLLPISLGLLSVWFLHTFLLYRKANH